MILKVFSFGTGEWGLGTGDWGVGSGDWGVGIRRITDAQCLMPIY